MEGGAVAGADAISIMVGLAVVFGVAVAGVVAGVYPVVVAVAGLHP